MVWLLSFFVSVHVFAQFNCPTASTPVPWPWAVTCPVSDRLPMSFIYRKKSESFGVVVERVDTRILMSQYDEKHKLIWQRVAAFSKDRMSLMAPALKSALLLSEGSVSIQLLADGRVGHCIPTETRWVINFFTEPDDAGACPPVTSYLLQLVDDSK